MAGSAGPCGGAAGAGAAGEPGASSSSSCSTRRPVSTLSGRSLEQLVAVTRASVRVALLDQEPVVAALAFLGLEPDQHPAAAELFAAEPELQRALPVLRLGIAHRDPAAAVPDDHGAGAILALGDRLLEVGVLQRVVLDVHGEPPDRGVERGPLRHRPALERVAELQPQVVVQAPRGMLLDHEHAGPGRDLAARRLRRLGKIALCPIALERIRRPASGHRTPRPRTFRRASLAQTWRGGTRPRPGPDVPRADVLPPRPPR